jgi:putative transposase
MPIKSVRQQYTPNPQQMQMMETFRQMVNHCVRIGLEHNKHTLKTLSPLAYCQLSEYQIQSKYKLTAISQACGRLSQMKRDIKNGRTPKSPFVRKPYLVSCYGFKINGVLLSFPVKNREFVNILLNSHTAAILADGSLKPRSFTITPTSLSISIQKNVEPMKTEKTIRIDRNLRNVTFGNHTIIVQVNTSQMLKIKENYNYIKSTFKRNDHRIRKRIAGKLGTRHTNRIRQK